MKTAKKPAATALAVTQAKAEIELQHVNARLQCLRAIVRLGENAGRVGGNCTEGTEASAFADAYATLGIAGGR